MQDVEQQCWPQPLGTSHLSFSHDNPCPSGDNPEDLQGLSNVSQGTQWPLVGSHSVEDLKEIRNKSHRQVGEETSGGRNSTCKGPAAGGPARTQGTRGRCVEDARERSQAIVKEELVLLEGFCQS